MKILAVTTEERLDFLPGVPTMKESGVDVVGSTWVAIYAPADVPRPIVDKLNAAIDAYLRKPETREQFGKTGLLAAGRSARAAARPRDARPCQVVEDHRRHEPRSRQVARAAIA